jgi:hypothetical protein
MVDLIELGAIQLIEMGRTSLGQAAKAHSPVLDLLQVTSFLENPAAGIEVEPGEYVTPKQVAIAQRLTTLSKMARRGLVRNSQETLGLGAVGLVREMRGISSELNRLGNAAASLGKFSAKKKLKKVGRKVIRVVKSPAFLSVAGVAANLIPGIGQAASASLMATAGIMAKRQHDKKAKKEMKKAERQAAYEASQADEEALNDWYLQYGSEYLAPMGYTPEVWSKLSSKEKREVAQKAADGTLEPYSETPVSQEANDEVARAAALSVAMKNKYGDQLPGEGVDLESLPPDVQQEALTLAPEYEKQIEAVGKDNFLAAAKKAVGQGSAISSFFKGVGAELPGGLEELFSKYKDEKAVEAGKQDLLNTAAFVGKSDVVGEILEAGTSSFPWEIVAIGAGGTAVIGGVIWILSRR